MVENQAKTRVWEDSSLCQKTLTINAVQEFHLGYIFSSCFLRIFFVPVHYNRLSFDMTLFLFSEDFSVFSFSLVYGDRFVPQWESVQHTLISVWVSIVFRQGCQCCRSRSGIQCLFDPGWKFGPAINIPDLQRGRVGDETRKVLAISAVIVSHLSWIRNTRSLRSTR